MSVVDPYTNVANALEAIITTEFTAEGVVPLHDKLHESLGRDGIEVGISPLSARPTQADAAVLETTVFVQFYLMWDAHIDPTQQVDPRSATAFFARFQYALESYQKTHTGTESVWYFTIVSVEFPDDPTGNKSRFEARVRAFGNNQGFMDRL